MAIHRCVYRKCDCGSNQPVSAHYDGYGIFLCYTCSECYQRKMQRYRRVIGMQRYEPVEEE